MTDATDPSVFNEQKEFWTQPGRWLTTHFPACPRIPPGVLRYVHAVHDSSVLRLPASHGRHPTRPIPNSQSWLFLPPPPRIYKRLLINSLL